MNRRDMALQVISNVSGTPLHEINLQHDLVTDLGIDSPKALKLLVQLEDALGIEISDEAAARMTTVGEVLEGLE